MNYVYDPSRRTRSSAVLIAALGTLVGAALAKGNWVYIVPLGAMMLLAAWPIETGLGAYALLLPFDSISRLGSSPDGRTVTWYAGALATFVLLAMGLLHDRFVRPPRATTYWFWFLILAGLSIFWAVDEDVLVSQLPTVLGLFALYFAASCFDISREQFLRVTQLAIVGAVAASAFSIMNFFSGVLTVEARSSLIVGSQQADPNLFSASLLAPLALAVGLLISSETSLGKMAFGAGSLTIMAAVLLTMSRGALLALLCMAIVYAYRYKCNRRLLVAMALTPALLVIAPSLFFSRFQNALSNGGAGRLDIWIAGFSAIKQFGLRGAGLENFPVVYQHFAGFAPVFRGYDRPAHNIYLETTVELGIVGVALLICAVLTHWKGVRSDRGSLALSPQPLLVACEAAAIGMLVAAFFVGMLWQKSFWMVWIFCIFGSRVIKQDNLSTSDSVHEESTALTYAASSF